MAETDLAAGKPFLGIRCVLSDSDYNVRKAFRSTLLRHGFDLVTICGDVTAFKRAMGEVRPHVVVVDLELPGGNIRSVVEDIRHGNAAEDPFLIVIGMTGDAREETIRRDLRAGFDDILLKPVGDDALVKRIHHIGQHRKPFVVTVSYVGPDRRAGVHAPDGKNVYAVPNALNRRQPDGPNDMDLRETIRRAIPRSATKRRWMTAARLIEVASDLAHRVHAAHGENSPVFAAASKAVIAIDHLAAAAEAGQEDKIGPLATALEKMADEISESTDGDTALDGRLLKQIADAIHLALQPT